VVSQSNALLLLLVYRYGHAVFFNLKPIIYESAFLGIVDFGSVLKIVYSYIRMPLPSSTSPRASASKLSVLNLSDAGLISFEGALHIIEALSVRKLVTTITLSHNTLGDDGCAALFQHLCSIQGRRYAISEINLIHNKIGDRGLAAIAEYLRNNTTLRELYLQYNSFSGDPEATVSFALAMNSASLRTLAISTNIGNGDSLITHILDNLNSPTLVDLMFSMTGVTYASTASIQSFLTDPNRCYLRSLRASANKLGIRGVEEIVSAVERHNWMLSKIDLFANWINDGDDADMGVNEGVPTAQRLRMWKTLEDRLKNVVTRNDLARRQTEREALALLRYSRAVLLHSTTVSSPARDVPTPSVPIPDLPMELRLHILSSFAPSLSTAQRIRVFNYASDPSTLPQLLPTLYSSNCLPDLSSLTFGIGGFSINPASSFGRGDGCSDGTCMGSGNVMSCRRDLERVRWLAELKCNVYEPDEYVGSEI